MIIRVQEWEEREKGKKCVWCNYGWKFPELELGNRYSSTGNTESLKQDEPKQAHTKTFHN